MIPVTEKLPKPLQPVVATRPGGYPDDWPFCVAIMYEDGDWQDSEARYIEVTHWAHVDIPFSRN
jgi:hypothetical protein